MAEVAIELRPEHAEFATSIAFPQTRRIDGTNLSYTGLFFDASTAESCFFTFRAIRYPNTGTISVDIEWTADTATSGNVVWEVAVVAYTSDTDSATLDGRSFATANSVTDGQLGTNARRVMKCTATIPTANNDSLTLDDLVVLRLKRDAANGSDTMSGDAGVLKVTIRYSDT